MSASRGFRPGLDPRLASRRLAEAEAVVAWRFREMMSRGRRILHLQQRFRLLEAERDDLAADVVSLNRDLQGLIARAERFESQRDEEAARARQGEARERALHAEARARETASAAEIAALTRALRESMAREPEPVPETLWTRAGGAVRRAASRIPAPLRRPAASASRLVWWAVSLRLSQRLAERGTIRRDLATLRRSAAFDAAWYAAHHPELAAEGVEPAAHYLFVGARRGAAPGPGLDPALYAAANPDLAAGGNPVLHLERRRVGVACLASQDGMQ